MVVRYGPQTWTYSLWCNERQGLGSTVINFRVFMIRLVKGSVGVSYAVQRDTTFVSCRSLMNCLKSGYRILALVYLQVCTVRILGFCIVCTCYRLCNIIHISELLWGLWSTHQVVGLGQAMRCLNHLFQSQRVISFRLYNVGIQSWCFSWLPGGNENFRSWRCDSEGRRNHQGGSSSCS